ncbi:hypothetical protein ACFV9D_00460 [Streptomyces sp. NPDC059875]|uniref:hypothetical protein n=1 Tax=unclassified Streptomyces TaxID=2593676 RepID=UPI0036499B49
MMREAHEEGLLPMRPLFLEFPNDQAACRWTTPTASAATCPSPRCRRRAAFADYNALRAEVDRA